MDDGSIESRTLPDGRHLAVWPMTFGNYRLTISRSAHDLCYIDGW